MKKIIVRTACIIALAMLVFGWNFSGLRAQGGHNITLTWTAPTSGGPPTGYKVERGTSAGTETLIATVPVPSLTYVDTNGVGGTTYFYVVVATNSAGDSPKSNEVSSIFLLDPPGAVVVSPAVAK